MNKKIKLSLALATAIFCVYGGGTTLVANETTVLDTIEVSTDYLGESTENSNSYGYKASKAATGLELSILRTPQSTDALTSKQLKDNINSDYSADKAVGNIVGISLDKSDTSKMFFHSRKTRINNIDIDGIPSSSDNDIGGLTDTAILDRIEVVRGSTGFIKGPGNPSASVNLVRKVPDVSKDFTRFGLSAGSWNFKRADLDASYALNEARSIKARLNVASQKGGSFLDRYKADKNLVYGVVDFNIGDSSLLRVGADYIANNSRSVMWGTKSYEYGNGERTNYPINYNHAPDWAKIKGNVSSKFLKFSHIFSNDFELDLNYHRQDLKQNWTRFAVDAEPMKSGYFTEAQSINTDTKRVIDIFSAKLSGDFKIAKVENKFSTTVDYRINNLKRDLFYPATSLSNNDYFPFSGRFFEGKFNDPKPDFKFVGKDSVKTEQTSISFIDNIDFSDKFSALIGLRFTKYKDKSISTGRSFYSNYTVDKNNISKFFGLSYEYLEGHSSYISMTDIFTPQEEVDINRKTLTPIVGTTYEIGFKSQFFNDSLNTNLAIFEIRRDIDSQYAGDFPDGTSYYEIVDGNKIKGFEISAYGKINDKLNIYTGYAYSKARNKDKEVIATRIPDKTFKLGFDYEVMTKLNLGANVNWQSTTYNIYGGKKYYVDSYALVDLHAIYKISPKFKIQANINNALDKKYLSGNWGYVYTDGEPRNFMFRTEYQF